MNETMNFETKTKIKIKIVKILIEKMISQKFFNLAMSSTNLKLSTIIVKKKSIMQKSVKTNNNLNKKNKKFEKKADIETPHSIDEHLAPAR